MNTRGPMPRVGLCALMVVALMPVWGCTPTVSGVSLVKAGKPTVTSAADSGVAVSFSSRIDDFGVDLWKATAASANEPGGNVIVSPVSVHAALSMTVNGATAETAAQMRTVLHTDSLDPIEANRQWADLLTELGKRAPEQTLEIADGLWARKGIAFKKPFLDADRDHFGAEIATLDFSKDNVGGAINAWVSRNTHGMITKMLEDGPKPEAVLFLANAVYFKGDWMTPFVHEGTRKAPFTRADGTKVDVEMMSSSGTMPYVANDVLQATRLPYQGLDSAFYVILPRPGVTLDAAMASMKGTGFTTLRDAMDSQPATEVVFGLPKMDVEFGADLVDPLKNMGMPRAFDANAAQFSGIADSPLYINTVLHRTKVRIDEEGTEAAAVTVIGVYGSAAFSQAVPPEIICDRPFIFAIVDQRSGAMLFLGSVGDPTK